MGSPIASDGDDEEQSRAVLHLAFICALYETQARGTVFSSHTFALRRELGPTKSGGCHEQVPRNVPNSD